MPTQIATSASTFLTNLRLLDLDCLEDWPNITAQLFASKDARANQKQRIRGSEWALYRLFELWNSQGAKNKLQPFFPPYDALRSINLRAALFRCLSEIKKDGVLGKEVIIRKTMFDECRGNKFEELLASFSTLVLQKILRRQSRSKASTSGRLTISQSVLGREQNSLLPLAIAHQGALRALLRRKAQLRQRYAELQSALKAKEQQLLARVEDLAQADLGSSLDAVPDRTVREIHQHLEGNWQGDVDWVKSIVEGDRRDVGDPLLDSAFPSVWTHVENGTVADIEANRQKGLLQDLSCRIHSQQMRLRHWQNVQHEMVKSRPRSPVKAKENATPYKNWGMQSPLKFGHVDRNQADGYMKSAGFSPETKMEYHKLLNRRNGNSTVLGLTDIDTPSKCTTGIDLSNTVSVAQAVSALQPSTLDLMPPATSQRHIRTSASELEGPFKNVRCNNAEDTKPPTCLSDSNETDEAYDATQRMTDLPAACDDRASHDRRSESQCHQQDHEGVPTGQRGFSAGPVETPSSLVLGNSPNHEEDALAQQIISSAMDAEPSAIKCKMSLMERTRQSIAFARPEAFLPDSLNGSTLVQYVRKADPLSTQCDTLPRSSSLFERTRRSISLVPAPKGPRKSIHSRQQLKQYPRNQFETPKKQLDDLKEITPPEILFSPEADYASVFKSRPKVATSPNLSPTLAKRLQWDNSAEDK
ncbi:MAG: hypothetical protein LQ338_004289 [Usnochroma carphineum]|nr:MAG: hypothetical protein LQ338_004289 [Usnochroma carphineum]